MVMESTLFAVSLLLAAPGTEPAPQAGAQAGREPRSESRPEAAETQPSAAAPAPAAEQAPSPGLDPDEEKALEEDMRRSRARLHRRGTARQAQGAAPQGTEGAVQREAQGATGEGSQGVAQEPGQGNSETDDWADDARWRRYRKRERGDRAGGDRWRRYGEAGGEEPGAAPDAPGSLYVPRPGPLRRRAPGGALVLGLLVGFGSGYYYAAEPRKGLLYSILDGVLVTGFVVSEVALIQLVARNDVDKGASLAAGQRDFGRRERNLYVAAWAFALGELSSRVLQSVGSFRAARRTNAVLDHISLVPLGAGVGARFEW